MEIEAEGYEPEVLSGCESCLNKIEYIAVDVGYESSEREEQIFTTITNFLLTNGFEMIDVYFAWQRALFRNKYA